MDPDSYTTQLKKLVQSVKPPSVRKHPHWNTHVNTDLSSSPFIFVRHDAVKRTLQPFYDGPFKVLHLTDKHYTLDISGQKKIVSLDRFKPAYMDGPPVTTTDIPTTADSPLAQPQPQTPTSSPPSTTTSPSATTCTTRSGCHVHWPKRFTHYT